MKKHVYHLDQTTRQIIFDRLALELAKEPGIVFAYVYGSAVDSEWVHDVDVGLYLDDSQLPRRFEFSCALADRLSDAIEIPVDVRILNAAPVSFLFHVLCGQLLFSRDEEQLTDLLEEIPRRYLDIAPLLRQYTKEAFAT